MLRFFGRSFMLLFFHQNLMSNVLGFIQLGANSPGGIEAGDRLLKWNGEEIEGLRSWRQTLGKHKPGDKAAVVVDRDGKELSIEVTLKAAGG